MVSATWWYAESLVISGTSALFWRRTKATNRITGTDRNMTMNAAASPTVMGKPRSTVTRRDSFSDVCESRGGAFAATEIPTANGMTSARVSHTIRTIQDGTAWGIGTNASRRAAIFGAAIPTRSTGPGDRRRHHDGEEGLLARGGLSEQSADRPPEERVQDLAGGFGDERQQRLQQSHAEKVGPGLLR